MTQRKKPENPTYFEYKTPTLICRVWTSPPGAIPRATCVITTAGEEERRLSREDIARITSDADHASV